jgi:hypothetical protein
MQPTFSLLNGLPYISGNAYAFNYAFSMSSPIETFNSAFPEFVGKFTVIDSNATPFGGHTIEFKDKAYETWFRLKYG